MAADSVTCCVAVDAAGGPWLAQLRLPAGSTVGDALGAARAQAGAAVAADWEGAACGIWGQRCGRDRPLVEGDRVELYRPLADDPRERRRRRSGPTRGPLRPRVK